MHHYENSKPRHPNLQTSSNPPKHSASRILALGIWSFFGAHLDTSTKRPLTPALSPSDPSDGERERRKSPRRSRQFSLSPSDGERAGVRGRLVVVSRCALMGNSP